MKKYPAGNGPVRVVLERQEFRRLLRGEAVKYDDLEIVLDDLGYDYMLRALNRLVPKTPPPVVPPRECAVPGCGQPPEDTNPYAPRICRDHLDAWAESAYAAKERDEPVPSLQEWLDTWPEPEGDPVVAEVEVAEADGRQRKLGRVRRKAKADEGEAANGTG